MIADRLKWIVMVLSCGSVAMGEGKFLRHQSGDSGLDFRNPFQSDHSEAYLYDSPFGCGAVAAGDVNGDGWADLFFTNGIDPNALYFNRGSWQFEKQEFPSGGNPWSTGATLVDIDGDKDLDIYVCNYGSPNQLWLNDGKGGFREQVAADWGLALDGPSLMATFCDYDRDGDLDVFIQNHRQYYPGRTHAGSFISYEDDERRVAPGYEKWYAKQDLGGGFEVIGEYGYPNRLLWQELGDDGVSVFVDVSEQAGIRGYGHSLSAQWWDFDEDGWMDLYESNDYADPDRLYRNQGDGTFVQVTEDYLPSVPWFSMGAAVADVNNDGRLDLFAADMAATTHLKAKIAMGNMGSRRWLLENGRPRQAMRNHLFVSSGRGPFLETAYLSGVAASDWTWTPCFGDFDQDGKVDLFVSNGMARFFTDSDGPVVGRELAHPGWEAMKVKRKTSMEAMSGWWSGLVAADVDGDGDKDLLAMNSGWNTKYGRPNPKKPAVLYYGTMEQGGQPTLVEAKAGDGELLPVRGRSCSSATMPWIADKFPSYRKFAEASLTGIYPTEVLAKARRYEAVCLTSGVFINQGGFQFRFEPFPVVAQLAPIYDAVVADWTGDGLVDLLLVQGFSGREPETGLWHGAPGVMLVGLGGGKFESLDGAASGFVVPGDGRRLELLRAGNQQRVLAVRNDDGVLMFEPKGGR